AGTRSPKAPNRRPSTMTAAKERWNLGMIFSVGRPCRARLRYQKHQHGIQIGKHPTFSIAGALERNAVLGVAVNFYPPQTQKIGTVTLTGRGHELAPMT